MPFRASLKKLIRRDTTAPSLRERAATLRASISPRVAEPRPLPAPGSEEAKAAWRAACHEHTIRTAALSACPELTRPSRDVWSTQSLIRALETGEITVAEYSRLHPLASERELRFAQIAHELNIGSLFALAYAGEYPTKAPKPDATPDPHAGPDAELLALAPQWQAAFYRYEQATERQVKVNTAAYTANPPGEGPAGAGPEWRAYQARVAEWRERTGVSQAEEASSEALHVLAEIEDRIAKMPAASLAGLKLKARVAQRCDEIDIDWPDHLGAGIARDILALNPEAADADAELLRLGREFEAARKREIAAIAACNAEPFEEPHLETNANDAGDVSASLAHRIAGLPARTAAGFRVKLQALSHYRRGMLLAELPHLPDPDQVLSHSLWHDVRQEEPAQGTPIPDRAWAIARAAEVDLSSLTILHLHNLFDRFAAAADHWCALSGMPWASRDRRMNGFHDPNAAGVIIDREEARAAEIRTRIAEEIRLREPSNELERNWRLETLIQWELLCEGSLEHAPNLRAEIAEAWGG